MSSDLDKGLSSSPSKLARMKKFEEIMSPTASAMTNSISDQSHLGNLRSIPGSPLMNSKNMNPNRKIKWRNEGEMFNQISKGSHSKKISELGESSH